VDAAAGPAASLRQNANRPGTSAIEAIRAQRRSAVWVGDPALPVGAIPPPGLGGDIYLTLPDRFEVNAVKELFRSLFRLE
jgi:hypothetical protein